MEDKLTCDQKLAKSMIKLRNLRPFYSSLYESLEKVPSSLIDTIGVTTNKIVYCPEFIDNTPFDELMFINLHEIAHIALMHVARRENRDPQLWNIACDLYVNQSLLEEFGLTVNKLSNINGMVPIKPPENGCYCTSIDLNKDYTELIYASLEEQGKENGYFDPNDRSEYYSFQYSGSFAESKNGIQNGFYSWSNFGKTHEKFEIKINRSMTAYSMDLIDNGDNQSAKEQQSRQIISDASVRAEMMARSVGDAPGNIERLVNELLKSHLDWKKLFRKYLTSIVSSDSSFTKPDKRMHWQKAIYPGQSSEESNYIEGIKICIDTSGSISEYDLDRFFYQVRDILKFYKVDAELIYWDANVQSAGSFKNVREFERVNCCGGGGTQPECVFKYFDDKKEKPRVILMFTDGEFFRDWSKNVNKRKYKDTIWVMTKEYDRDFKPPFGRMAIAKFN